MCVCVVITWQRLVAGQFPLQSDRLGSAVHPAPEAGRLPHTHCSTVGLNGDDWALKTYSRNQRFGHCTDSIRTLLFTTSLHLADLLFADTRSKKSLAAVKELKHRWCLGNREWGWDHGTVARKNTFDLRSLWAPLESMTGKFKWESVCLRSPPCLTDAAISCNFLNEKVMTVKSSTVGTFQIRA